MKKNILTLALFGGLCFTVSAVGCGDDETGSSPASTATGPGSGGSDMGGSGPGTGGDGDGGTANGTGGDGGTPGAGGGGAAPFMGQIDRKGRPAINTAVNATFATEAAAHETAQDDWNTNDDPSTWATDYAATIAGQLGILDGLDGTCGNQLAFGDPLSADPANENYEVLSLIFANDWLVINLNGGNGTAGYLGGEAQALGGNASTGGRLLTDDVLEATYSYAIVGAATGINDGVTEPTPAVSGTFPYLADAL